MLHLQHCSDGEHLLRAAKGVCKWGGREGRGRGGEGRRRGGEGEGRGRGGGGGEEGEGREGRRMGRRRHLSFGV